MTILTKEQLEQYKGLKLDMLRGKVSISTFEKLLRKDEETQYGVIYSLAGSHHLNRKSMKELGKELDLSYTVIWNIFRNLTIPTLSPKEGVESNIKLGRGIYAATEEQKKERGRLGGKRLVELGLGAHAATQAQRKEWTSKAGKRAAELKVGVHGATHEQHQEWGKHSAELKVGMFAASEEQIKKWKVEAGKRSAELGAGVHGAAKEQRREWSSKAGRIGGKISGNLTLELGLGIFGANEEQRKERASKAGKVGGPKLKELGLGIFGANEEQRSEWGRIGGKLGGNRCLELRVGICDPKNANMPTIHGRRRDLEQALGSIYHARSVWEANLARLLLQNGFLIEPHAPVELNITDTYSHLFDRKQSAQFIMDFIAISPKGSEYWYEIMAHPFENPIGIAKIGMFRDQYPDRNLVIVTPDKYMVLEQAFRERIDNDEMFIGWETKEDNLRTSPDKWAVLDDMPKR